MEMQLGKLRYSICRLETVLAHQDGTEYAYLHWSMQDYPQHCTFWYNYMYGKFMVLIFS